MSFQYDGPDFSVLVDNFEDTVTLGVNAQQCNARVLLLNDEADAVAVALIQATPLKENELFGDVYGPSSETLKRTTMSERIRIGLALIRSAK